MMKRKTTTKGTTTRKKAAPKNYRVIVETKTESKLLNVGEAMKLTSAMKKKIGRRKGVKVRKLYVGSRK